MKTVIIMCDGLGNRWISPDVKYKHLIPFDGIPLVFRTIHQLQQYPCNIILIAPEEFKDYDHYPDEVFHTSLGYRETEPRTLLDGILRTKALWTEDTIILLGDVVFSNAAIKMLLESSLPYTWMFGRTDPNPFTGKLASELFAFSFNPYQDNIIGNINSMLGLSGKLWEYYYTYDLYLLKSRCYTDDFDSPEAYQQFYDKMLEAVRKDDYEQIP